MTAPGHRVTLRLREDDLALAKWLHQTTGHGELIPPGFEEFLAFELRKQLRARMREIAVDGEAEFPPEDD